MAALVSDNIHAIYVDRMPIGREQMVPIAEVVAVLKQMDGFFGKPDRHTLRESSDAVKS